ncbi:hypothetical protein ACHWQZ_G009986 [Mnemiopsis leidyi]
MSTTDAVNSTINYDELFTEERAVDISLGVIYIFCFLFGLPGNLIAFTYFLRLKKDVSTSLYMVITAMDATICAASIFPAFNMIAERAPVLFQYPWFCVGWRMVFKSLQRLSVFLVLVLTMSRTAVLLIPLHHVRKKSVLGAILAYVLYLVLENAVLERLEKISYNPADGYCYEDDNPRLVSVLNDALHVSTLALPLIPIVISCVVSVHHVRNTAHISAHSDTAGSNMKRRATVTVILFTIIYLFFNIPLIANLVVWIVTVSHYGGWPGPVYTTNTFFYLYLWNLTEVLFVGLNAAVNPIIYFMRFPDCQRWTIATSRRCYARLTGREIEELPTRTSFMIDRGSRVLSANYSNCYSDIRIKRVTQQSIMVLPPSPDGPDVVHDEEVVMEIFGKDNVTRDVSSIGNELDTISVSNDSIDNNSVYSNKSVNGMLSEKLYTEDKPL